MTTLIDELRSEIERLKLENELLRGIKRVEPLPFISPLSGLMSKDDLAQALNPNAGVVQPFPRGRWSN